MINQDVCHEQYMDFGEKILVYYCYFHIFIYCFHCRAAEGLLNRVKKLFQDPHNKTNELNLEVKDKLSHFQDKLEDILDMLREAQGKIKESNHLSAVNKYNMTALEVIVYINIGKQNVLINVLCRKKFISQ